MTGKKTLDIRPWTLDIRHRRAFTLIELLVVISVIGVLMVVGSYAYSVISARSRDNSRKSDLARIQNAMQQHYLDLRSYPKFDYSGSGSPIYSAAWQLSPSISCNHGNSDLLAPRYMATIPDDPEQKTDSQGRSLLVSQNCASLTSNQVTRYLYVAGSDGSGPTTSPTVFGLFATLEKPAASDVVTADNNPLLPCVSGTCNGIAKFGSWFSTFDNFGKNINLGANYLVTGSVGK